MWLVLDAVGQCDLLGVHWFYREDGQCPAAFDHVPTLHILLLGRHARHGDSATETGSKWPVCGACRLGDAGMVKLLPVLDEAAASSLQRGPFTVAVLAPPWIAVPPPGYGGIESVVSLLCDALVARGHDVTLFAGPGSSSKARVETVLPRTYPDEIERALYEADHVARVLRRRAISPQRPRRVCSSAIPGSCRSGG